VVERNTLDQEQNQNGVTSQTQNKDTFIKRSRDFIQGAVDSFTGKDLPMLVEDFTREMTIVAEGLAEDQARLADSLRRQGEGQDQLAEKMRQVERRLNDRERKITDIQKKLERKKENRPGLSQILKQATWLAGILAAAWVITTLLKTFGR
jgi:predicted RNase H-like nuclease (RuvC/YqgF family)